MFKKVLCLLFAVCTVFSFSACRKNPSDPTFPSNLINPSSSSAVDVSSDFVSSELIPPITEAPETSADSSETASSTVSSSTDTKKVLTEEEIRNIIKSELEKNPSGGKSSGAVPATPQEKKFVAGASLTCPVGTNFTMPINTQINKTATITSFSVKTLKIADVSNRADYYTLLGTNYHVYYRYIYQLEMSGKVDPSFSGRAMNVLVAFESGESLDFYDVPNNIVTINSDGTFSLSTRIGSNKIESYAYPRLLNISEY